MFCGVIGVNKLEMSILRDLAELDQMIKISTFNISVAQLMSRFQNLINERRSTEILVYTRIGLFMFLSSFTKILPIQLYKLTMYFLVVLLIKIGRAYYVRAVTLTLRKKFHAFLWLVHVH